MAFLTGRSELSETPADDDVVHIVDVSDTTDNAAGTSKKVTRSNLVGGLAASGHNHDGTYSATGHTHTEADVTDLAHKTDIDSLDDVTITTPADNEVLAYDTTAVGFINQTPAEAGLAEATHSHTESDISDLGTYQVQLLEGAFVDGDKTKLDGIETGADVTDATNVASAGALMSGTASLDSLSAVDTDKSKTPADGDVLTFDGTDWNAETPSAGGGQTLYDVVLDASGGGDYTDFNTAISALTTGQTLFIRSGTYTMTANASIATAGIQLIGENRQTTIIRLSSYSLTLSGADSGVNNIRWETTSGTFTLSSEHGFFENNHFLSSTINIQLLIASNYISVNNNHFEHTGSASNRMLYVNGVIGTTIVGNIFELDDGSNSASQGTVYDQGYGTSIVGNTFMVVNHLAVNAPIIYTYSMSTVANNVLRISGTSNGLYIYSYSNDNVIDGNTCNVIGSGIKVRGEHTIVSNNKITLNYNNSSIYGVQIESGGGSNTVMITGNVIENLNSTGYGVWILNSSNDSTVISNNLFYGGFTAQVRVSYTYRGLAITNNTSVFSGSGTTNTQDAILIDNWTDYEVIIDGNNFGSIVQKYEVYENNSGANILAGSPVIYDYSNQNIREVVTTTTQGDSRVVGVASDGISTGYAYPVITEGLVDNLKVDGTVDIAIGDELTCSATAGVAEKASSGDTVFAIAKEAYTTDDANGVIDAIIIKPYVKA